MKKKKNGIVRVTAPDVMQAVAEPESHVTFRRFRQHQRTKWTQKHESTPGLDEIHTNAPSNLVTARVCNLYIDIRVESSRHFTDLARAKITRDVFNPG